MATFTAFELNQYPLRIEITNKCNLSCDYCLSLTSCHYRNRPETDFDALTKFIRYLRLSQLLLLGGEVCYYYKINELADYCFKNRVGLFVATNGTMLDRYKAISDINRGIVYFISYNGEGCNNRLEMCDEFIKEMNVSTLQILVNRENEGTIVNSIEKFQKMNKIRQIYIFSDEQTEKGRYYSLFDLLISRYDKVFIYDYALNKAPIEGTDTSKRYRYKIRCANPLSLKGNDISFCKNIEDFGMNITEIDFSKKENVNNLKIKFNEFQKKMNLGQIEYCRQCRFSERLTKIDAISKWVFKYANLMDVPINCISLKTFLRRSLKIKSPP